MKAIDIKKHMQEVGTWVNWEHTCDRFIFGDPDTQVTGIAVAWQARTAAIKQALDMGCNLFITHEPVFYRHMDDDESVFNFPHAQKKRELIEESGLVIFRCHDVWDRMPGVGIVDSWAEHLGLTQKTASDAFHSVYTSPKPTAGELARYIANKTSDLGQEAVQLTGNPNAKVTKVAIGCGAITNYEAMVNLGADALIGTDDGMNYWAGGAWALDRETPLIIVNHCTAEESGMRNLARYIAQHFPDVRTEFIAQGCMYQTILNA